MEIGEYYYFSRTLIAAGVITRYTGDEMVLRHLEFKDGRLISQDRFCRTFEAMVGNTKYTYAVGIYSKPKVRFSKKPPQKK